MHPSVNNAGQSLEQLKIPLNNSIPNDQPLNTFWGWNMPAVTRKELSGRIDETQQRLMALPDKISDRDRDLLDATPARLQFWQAQVLPNIQGGNSVWVVMSLEDELRRLERLTAPYLLPPPPPAPDWEKLADDDLLPPKLAARLRSLNTRMDRVVPQFDKLEAQVKFIGQAYETADKLPESIASLEEARREMATARTEAQSQAAAAARHKGP